MINELCGILFSGGNKKKSLHLKFLVLKLKITTRRSNIVCAYSFSFQFLECFFFSRSLSVVASHLNFFRPILNSYLHTSRSS